MVIQTLDNFISYLNTLYEADSTAPTSGDEDYSVWTDLANIAIDLWENEEGVLWNELFTTLDDAASTVTKTVTAGTYDYTCPTDFSFLTGKVRLVGASSGNSTYFTVIKPEEVQLYDDTTDNWCYFTGNLSAGYTLHFNPNITLTTGDTIKYEYYKKATALSSGSDKFEMSDPMFAVFYALSELKKEEGDTSAATIATQKLEGMKTKNLMPSYFQENAIKNKMEEGFGV